PEAGRAREQQVIGGLAAPAGRGQHDLEVLLEARLPDELVEPARPERRLLRLLRRVGRRAGQLLTHGTPPAGAARRATGPRARRPRATTRARHAPRRVGTRAR